VEGGADMVGPGEGPDGFETFDDPLALGQVAKVVSDSGVGVDRENLAVDAKVADAGSSAKRQRSMQRLGVMHTDFSQVRRSFGAGQGQQVLCRGTAKFDGFFAKDTAQAKADHWSASRWSTAFNRLT